MGRVLIKSQTHQDQNTLQQNSGEGAKLMTGKYISPAKLIKVFLDATAGTH